MIVEFGLTTIHKFESRVADNLLPELPGLYYYQNKNCGV